MREWWASPLAPAVCVVGYLVAAGAGFGIYSVVCGRVRDRETEARSDSVVLPMGARVFFMWALRPLWFLVRWSGVPATAITTVATLFAFGAGLAAAQGSLALAGWLYLAAGIGDVFDGRVARLQGTANSSGAAIDSILDRYSDAAVPLGLAWYFRGGWPQLMVLAALVGTLLVSYVRARGEGLGVSVTVGTMQRPERVALLGSALALGPAFEALMGGVSADGLLIATVTLIAVATHATALHRLLHLLRRLRQGRREHASWRRFAPAAVSAFLATLVDFALVVFLVSNAGMSAAPATAIGCILGGAANFSLNRWWTFASRDRPAPQALRYVIVSTVSAMLNGGGVALVVALPLPDYRIGWLLVRGLVFVCWNFPLQRGYVYGSRGRGKPAIARGGGRADAHELSRRAT